MKYRYIINESLVITLVTLSPDAVQPASGSWKTSDFLTDTNIRLIWTLRLLVWCGDVLLLLTSGGRSNVNVFLCDHTLSLDSLSFIRLSSSSCRVV